VSFVLSPLIFNPFSLILYSISFFLFPIFYGFRAAINRKNQPPMAKNGKFYRPVR
jgi:hypothetical protein